MPLRVSCSGGLFSEIHVLGILDVASGLQNQRSVALFVFHVILHRPHRLSFLMEHVTKKGDHHDILSKLLHRIFESRSVCEWLNNMGSNFECRAVALDLRDGLWLVMIGTCWADFPLYSRMLSACRLVGLAHACYFCLLSALALGLWMLSFGVCELIALLGA